MREPAALVWVLHQALGESSQLDPHDAWNEAVLALASSRLSALFVHLLGPGISQLPREARLPLGALALESEAESASRAAQLEEAADLLERCGIPWVTLKGWSLAARLYPSPSCRPSGDLDLLVLPGDRLQAAQMFVRAGYRAGDADHPFHQRLLRSREAAVEQIIELHHWANPPADAGPRTEIILETRQLASHSFGPVWIPSVDLERDLLLRHYLRHSGCQAILLLDLLLHLKGAAYRHPLGAIIGDDLARLGFPRMIDGAHRWRHLILRRWLSRRTFAERRAARHPSSGLPLVLGRSAWSAVGDAALTLWPRRPTPRWRALSETRMGRFTWRFRRLARLGK